MEIDVTKVKELREKTGAGVMALKKLLKSQVVMLLKQKIF